MDLAVLPYVDSASTKATLFTWAPQAMSRPIRALSPAAAAVIIRVRPRRPRGRFAAALRIVSSFQNAAETCRNASHASGHAGTIAPCPSRKAQPSGPAVHCSAMTRTASRMVGEAGSSSVRARFASAASAVSASDIVDKRRGGVRGRAGRARKITVNTVVNNPLHPPPNPLCCPAW